ncbi:creatininase family protein [Halalkalicoccus salilacus]|uniref:creatininase family protein n=1 Tax=Halalkalicoccus TaxID=332246 RepID=UPI002F9674EB
MPEEHEIADLTWRELETATDETSTPLLPAGSTERHGLHLPLGVDTYMPEAIARRVAERSPRLLAPSTPYGVSPHYTFKPGTVTVESETF